MTAPLLAELQRCAEDRHPQFSIKTITTDAGTVYACERCSAHWFRKYGDHESDMVKSGETRCVHISGSTAGAKQCILRAGHGGDHWWGVP